MAEPVPAGEARLRLFNFMRRGGPIATRTTDRLEPGAPPGAVPVLRPPGEAEPWFRTLAETTATAIFVYRDTFLYVNQACEELTGYSSAELLGMPLGRLVHPDFRDEVAERVQARLRGEDVPRQYQTRIVRKDGEARWIDLYGGLVLMDGEPAGMARSSAEE